MYPITPIGRILACICAFFGVAVSGMLVSVLVDRYQRVYNRKKYFPEQILSVADSSDDELNEKQDFINRKLSGTRKNLTNTGGSNIPLSSPPFILTTNYRKSFQSSSYMRFVITIVNNQNINRLMDELNEIVRNTGNNIHLKLINAENDSSNQTLTTINQLPSINEE